MYGKVNEKAENHFLFPTAAILQVTLAQTTELQDFACVELAITTAGVAELRMELPIVQDS